jgi:phage N-6-adenine-methyltransferase
MPSSTTKAAPETGPPHGRDEWGTPDALFDWLHKMFKFTVDVCATKANTKCPLFITPEADGLEMNWVGTCWCNPPYSRGQVKLWVEKAHNEAVCRNVTTVMLLNYVLDAEYLQKYTSVIDRAIVLSPRLQFVPPPGITPSTNARGQMLLVFTPWAARGLFQDQGLNLHHMDLAWLFEDNDNKEIT